MDSMALNVYQRIHKPVHVLLEIDIDPQISAAQTDDVRAILDDNASLEQLIEHQA
jgi:hypothetical protein